MADGLGPAACADALSNLLLAEGGGRLNGCEGIGVAAAVVMVVAVTSMLFFESLLML